MFKKIKEMNHIKVGSRAKAQKIVAIVFVSWVVIVHGILPAILS